LPLRASSAEQVIGEGQAAEPVATRTSEGLLKTTPIGRTWQTNLGQATVQSEATVGGQPRLLVKYERGATELVRPEELESRIASDVKMYESRQKMAAGAQAQREAEQQEKTKYQDFTQSMTPMQASKAFNALETNVQSGEQLFKRGDLVKQAVDEGAEIVIARDGKRRLQKQDGSYRTESQISKTAMDYADYLIQHAAEPAGISVGNRITLGKSPQTYIIEEVIPQTAKEKEMGEQYYSVRNEKTGETQAVMTKDIKKVVKAKDLKMVKKMPIRKAISKPVPTAPEKRVEIKSIIEVAMKMFGSDFVAGRLYVMDDVNEESKAGYDPEDGTIYLNLAFMDTDDSIRDLIAHELGHYIFGDPSLRSKFTEFINSLPKRERVILDRFVNKVYRKDTGEVKIEEKEVRAFIMRLNAGDNRNKFQKLLDGIKRWLNEKLGTKFKMTDRDAAILLAGAVDRFKSGELIEREEGFGVRKMAAERSEDVSEAIDNSKRINDIANATAKKLGKDSENFHNAYVNEGKSEDAIAKEFGVSASSVRLSLLKTSNEIKQELKKSKLDQVKEQPIGEVISWTKESAKKYLTKEGALPGGTYQNFVKRNSKISMEAEETRQAIEDLYKGLREIYKINRIKWIFKGLSSIPFDEVAKLNDALAGDIEITEMPEQIQEPLTRMRQHIDALSAELINTGQLSDKLEGKILDKMGVYLTRSYKIFTDPKWINKIPEQKLNTARNFLFQQTVKTNPNFTIEDADRQLRNMLNDWAGEKPIDGKRGGRLGAKDMSILMTRSDVPKQLRDVMGENTNIIFNYANTVSKISRFIADQKFLDAVKKEGAGKFLFTKDSAPAGFNSLIAPEESRTMAPLSGLRTTPEIAKAFEEFGKSYDVSQNPFLYGLAWLNAVGKANLTVGSILTQMRNLVGQPFFFLTNAHTDMSVIGKEIDRLINEKNITKEEAKRLLIKNAAGQALVGENAYAGELREAFKDVGLQTFEDMDADEFSRQFVLARIFKKGVRGAQNIYQKTDEFGKIIGWLNETKRIQKINKGISLEDASSIAAERVRNTYPTYSQSSEILRIFRRQPFIGPFATFFYETFRTTFWNLKYAFEDINSGTPEGKTEGIKRLTGAMIQISTGMFFANAISMMISGIDDQEEEDVRRMLPPWAQDASLIWFPQTKDGVYNFINFSYLNPYNAITDPFVTMMSGLARGEDPVDIFIDAAGTYLKPFTSEQPVTAAIMDASRNITETGKKVYNVEDTMPTKTTKILMHIFGKAFTPGTVDRLRKRIIPAVYGETVGTRAPEPYKEIASELTGVRFENLDMRQAFQNKAWEFNKAQNESERIFRDVATRRRRVTEEEQISAYRTAEQSRYENWQDMYRNYMAVRRAGASNSEAVRLMIDINISKREASYIARGMYVPYQVSDEVRRRVKANGNTIPLTEIRAIGKEMPKVLQDVK
jgi:transposase